MMEVNCGLKLLETCGVLQEYANDTNRRMEMRCFICKYLYSTPRLEGHFVQIKQQITVKTSGGA